MTIPNLTYNNENKEITPPVKTVPIAAIIATILTHGLTPDFDLSLTGSGAASSPSFLRSRTESAMP